MNNFARFTVPVKFALASLAVAAGSAHAALPADVKTALDTAKSDGVEAAGIVLVAIVAIYAFKLIRRAL